jgi:two-component system sensor histidine kinase AlgZ
MLAWPGGDRYIQKMTSIRHSLRMGASLGAPSLPDFGNLGVWLRILLGVNGLALLAALVANQRLADLPGEMSALAVHVEPPLIVSLLLLNLARPLLQRRAGWPVLLGVLALVLLVVATSHGLLGAVLIDVEMPTLGRSLFWALLCCVALLYYFDQRSLREAPALNEARLMALTARIRPHFLFNSLNAVLGVIRAEPRRAEAALEELADLFRVLMRENRELTRLSEEISLARQYLSLERLRLGERLQIRWEIDTCPPDALLPPLMLQPLLENAVYHGIEPLDGPGEILIHFSRRGKDIIIEISNPCPQQVSPHAGNQMALANIRERLMLFFDLEARLEVRVENPADVAGGQRYCVRIELPYRSHE